MSSTPDSEKERLRQQLFGNFTPTEHLWIQLYFAAMEKVKDLSPASWVNSVTSPDSSWIRLTPGRLYHLPQGIYEEAVGLFASILSDPRKTWEYIGMMRAVPEEYRVRVAAEAFFDIEPSELDNASREVVHNLILEIDGKNVLKRARTKEGRDISAIQYANVMQQLLHHPFLLKQQFGSHAESALVSLRTGDFCRNMILEEVVDEDSRNANARVRLFLNDSVALGPGRLPLDAFVKFYSAQQKEQRDFEACLNHYLGGTSPLASVGRAQSVDLSTEIVLPRGNRMVTCKYALVTPFATEVQTLDEFVRRSPEHKSAVLQSMNDTLLQLHLQGMPNLGILRVLENMADVGEQEFDDADSLFSFSLDDARDTRKDAEVLRSRFYTADGEPRCVDYEQRSHALFDPAGELNVVYNEQYIISALLTKMALIAPSFIHGDVRPKNVLISPHQGKIILTDFEDEFVGFGAPQEDLAKLYSYRSLGLSIGEQETLVRAYVEKRALPEHHAPSKMDVSGLFVLGYHAAAIYKHLVHLKYVSDNSGERYSLEQAYDLMRLDLQTIEVHAAKLASDGVHLFRKAVCSEYGIIL